VSSTRKRERRSHDALTVPDIEECPHCHQPKRIHHACPECGWYGGREAVRIRTRTKPEQSS
jgi:large subunit ribosomal protein L32